MPSAMPLIEKNTGKGAGSGEFRTLKNIKLSGLAGEKGTLKNVEICVDANERNLRGFGFLKIYADESSTPLIRDLNLHIPSNFSDVRYAGLRFILNLFSGPA